MAGQTEPLSQDDRLMLIHSALHLRHERLQAEVGEDTYLTDADVLDTVEEWTLTRWNERWDVVEDEDDHPILLERVYREIFNKGVSNDT